MSIFAKTTELRPADELEGLGLIASRSEMMYRNAVDPGGVVFVVYNVAVNIVTLTGTPAQIVALRNAIVRWVQKTPAEERPYSLEANGPGGSISLSMDVPPDIEALDRLLQSIYAKRGRQ